MDIAAPRTTTRSVPTTDSAGLRRSIAAAARLAGPALGGFWRALGDAGAMSLATPPHTRND